MARDRASARNRAKNLTRVLQRFIQQTGFTDGAIHIAFHQGQLGPMIVEHRKAEVQADDAAAGAAALPGGSERGFLTLDQFHARLKQQLTELLSDSQIRFGSFHVCVRGGKIGKYEVISCLRPDELDELARVLYLAGTEDDDASSNQD